MSDTIRLECLGSPNKLWRVGELETTDSRVGELGDIAVEGAADRGEVDEAGEGLADRDRGEGGEVGVAAADIPRGDGPVRATAGCGGTPLKDRLEDRGTAGRLDGVEQEDSLATVNSRSRRDSPGGIERGDGGARVVPVGVGGPASDPGGRGALRGGLCIGSDLLGAVILSNVQDFASRVD